MVRPPRAPIPPRRLRHDRCRVPGGRVQRRRRLPAHGSQRKNSRQLCDTACGSRRYCSYISSTSHSLGPNVSVAASSAIAVDATAPAEAGGGIGVAHVAPTLGRDFRGNTTKRMPSVRARSVTACRAPGYDSGGASTSSTALATGVDAVRGSDEADRVAGVESDAATVVLAEAVHHRARRASESSLGTSDLLRELWPKLGARRIGLAGERCTDGAQRVDHLGTAPARHASNGCHPTTSPSRSAPTADRRCWSRRQCLRASLDVVPRGSSRCRRGPPAPQLPLPAAAPGHPSFAHGNQPARGMAGTCDAL